MVSRNYRIQAALVSAVTDARIAVEVRKNLPIKKLILDDDGENFWLLTRRVELLLLPVCTGILFCEGDGVSISVMGHIWGHIMAKLSLNALSNLGFGTDEIEEISERVVSRRKMNMTPVVCAAYALDPRFEGKLLTPEEWNEACEFLVGMTRTEGRNASLVLRDIAMYRLVN